MNRLAAAAIIILSIPVEGISQNCCAPTIPQQGVLGEMATLPHTLEIGFHYQYLRSATMYDGSRTIDDPANTRTLWQRGTMTLAYGVLPRVSISAIVPYAWKKKTKDLTSIGMRLENSTDGVGDIMILGRCSPIGRSFVSFRELSIGLGVKLPTGSVDKRNFGFLLPQELQPGTGSWDFDGSFSYFQGFERVDLVLSGTCLLTTSYNGYRFGNQFSYILASNFHIRGSLDLSLSLMGLIRGKDDTSNVKLSSTGRDQIWFSPGVKFQVLPEKLSLQAYYEHPVYQRFNGAQLGSEFNFRFSAIYLLQMKKSNKE